MRISVFAENRHTVIDINVNIINVTGTLILVGDPTSNLQAATKQYVDNKFSSPLSADNITSGTLNSAVLPAFTGGDVISSAGSNVLTLVPTGVTPGTYPKVTVEPKGRVTFGTTLSSSDIPDLDWSKITTGKPTTTAGYGITDALSKSGGTVTGFISINLTPTLDNQLINKRYVDSYISSVSPLAVGSVIFKRTDITPPGFLRCNGAEVSKTTYANLYAAIGDAHNNSDVIGYGKPWKQQYYINTEQSTEITQWSEATDSILSVARGYAQAVVTKNRVYLMGGWNDGASESSNAIMAAPINSDGTLGQWVFDTIELPTHIDSTQLVVIKKRIYLLGGSHHSSSISTVYNVAINEDGTIDDIWFECPSLPIPIESAQAIVIKDRVYLLGGKSNDNTLSTVYTATVDEDGVLGEWSSGPSLPVPISHAQAIVTKNRVYLIGGYDGNNTLSTVYTTTIDANGMLGEWTTGPSLPAPVDSAQAVVTKNMAYLLGGEDNDGNELSTVYNAPVNPDGTLGIWAAGPSLPVPLANSQVIITQNNIYLIGGYTNGDPTYRVYKATISGGLIDYSLYYGEIDPVINPDKFKLPDYSYFEPDQYTHAYIKY